MQFRPYDSAYKSLSWGNIVAVSLAAVGTGVAIGSGVGLVAAGYAAIHATGWGVGIGVATFTGGGITSGAVVNAQKGWAPGRLDQTTTRR